MILELFTALSAMLHDSAHLALAASFAWGILSIVLSPCHLASIPLIVGFIDEQGRISTGRAFVLSLLFSTGILITIGLIGLVTGLAGRMLGDIGRWGNYFIAVIFFIIGLHLLGVVPLPFLERGATAAGFKRRGLSPPLSWPGLRRGPGPLHLRLHGPHAGCGLHRGCRATGLCRDAHLAYAVGHCSIIVLPAPSPKWSSIT
jgi:cytochrome c-type biogenesis protein